MIRSSRIPTLLNKICTNGIQSCLLITKNGELLGCSSEIGVDSNAPTDSPDIPPLLGPEHSASSPPPHQQHQQSKWGGLDPSDIGALVAEVVADYKRLGSELALLDPTSPSGNGGRNSNAPTQSGVVATDVSTRGEVDMKGDVAGVSGSVAGGLNNKRNIKERGRLNCFIVELDMGLIGIASATSDTYIVALTGSEVQHGMLKGCLVALASHVGEAFLQLGE